jgi:glycosyltransferase involved in cell wall biosynthesis/GT2 family glycosyltransferase
VKERFVSGIPFMINDTSESGIDAPNAAISVVMPVFNGQETLDRAIRSVTCQTFQAWELLIVDDASTDDSAAILQAWVTRDSRIRLLRNSESNGVSAACNLGVRHARGEMICHLRQYDEYLPDYLATVDAFRDKADVLAFEYDCVCDSDPAEMPAITWRPREVKELMFVRCLARPLGVSYHRKLTDAVGGFNELLWSNEDWDLWRRFARAGATFFFVPHKSGRCYVSARSQRRISRMTRRQKDTLKTNRLAGRPLFAHSIDSRPCRQTRKIAFISPHCVLDFTNGAAVATYAGLRMAAKLGFNCDVLCSSQMDSRDATTIEDVFARQGITYEVCEVSLAQQPARFLLTQPDGFPVTVFEKASAGSGWSEADTAAFLTCCEEFLRENRPDLVWTYGGDPVSLAIHALVKQMDIPIVFALHNFSYRHAEMFCNFDYVVVPAEYSRRYYWERLGLACQILPNIVNWEQASVERREPRYVTFINPVPHKGVHIFARIARELARRRPDIPLLVTQGRSPAASLNASELKLAPLVSGRWLPDGSAAAFSPIGESRCERNITVMPYTPDPRIFYPSVYSATKILLMPSLWEEAFGLVAAEAMLNGIPVLASNRGALPNTLGKGGFLFDIPDWYTPETRVVPTASEVEPWVETIIRLWDDVAHYEQASQAARCEAQRWHPDRLSQVYADFFSNIHHQPGPPILI